MNKNQFTLGQHFVSASRQGNDTVSWAGFPSRQAPAPGEAAGGKRLLQAGLLERPPRSRPSGCPACAPAAAPGPRRRRPGPDRGSAPGDPDRGEPRTLISCRRPRSRAASTGRPFPSSAPTPAASLPPTARPRARQLPAGARAAQAAGWTPSRRLTAASCCAPAPRRARSSGK